uniref:Thioredoxin-like fold domain-containing protein n=1 Tax=Tanacetum cinerariifolium TaxID=118510 RepID=A0A699GEY5_TANCI|nr:hypothetical protein [Tanacetum cinerariifolium]
MNSSIGSTPARGIRRGARRCVGGILLGTALLSALPALADGRSAVRNLHANAARARIILNLTEQSTQATPTLVRGVYALTDAQGKGAGYINESGTLYGDASGFRVFPADGSPPRTLTPAETAVLRGEVMQAIDYDQLIKVQYGDGGGRRMVMFSALDCGYCKLFEKHFSELGKTNNTTFYVVPLSLRSSQAGGAQRPVAAGARLRDRCACGRAVEPGAADDPGSGGAACQGHADAVARRRRQAQGERSAQLPQATGATDPDGPAGMAGGGKWATAARGRGGAVPIEQGQPGRHAEKTGAVKRSPIHSLKDDHAPFSTVAVPAGDHRHSHDARHCRDGGRRGPGRTDRAGAALRTADGRASLQPGGHPVQRYRRRGGNLYRHAARRPDRGRRQVGQADPGGRRLRTRHQARHAAGRRARARRGLADVHRDPISVSGGREAGRRPGARAGLAI